VEVVAKLRVFVDLAAMLGREFLRGTSTNNSTPTTQ
jgi:hypothetical protein